MFCLVFGRLVDFHDYFVLVYLEMMPEAVGLSLGLGLVLFLGLLQAQGVLAVDRLLDGKVVATFAELVAAVDTFAGEVDVEDLLAEALFILFNDHTDLVLGHFLLKFFHCVRVFKQVPLNAGRNMLLVFQFQGLVLDHFLFEVVEGGFGIEEAGFEGDADISAIVVEDAVEEAATLV